MAFLDADDLLPPQAFRVLLDGLREDPDAQVVKGRGRFRHLRERDWMEGDLSDFPHHLGGSLYRREIFSKVGGLDETLRYAEDSDWHHRAVEAGIRFRLVGKVTLMIRRHPGNMTLGLDARALGRLEVVRRALRRRRMGAAG